MEDHPLKQHLQLPLLILYLMTLKKINNKGNIMINASENPVCQVYLPTTMAIGTRMHHVSTGAKGNDRASNDNIVININEINNSENTSTATSIKTALWNLISYPFYYGSALHQHKTYERMNVVSSQTSHDKDVHPIKEKEASFQNGIQEQKKDYSQLKSKMMLGISALLFATGGGYLFYHYLKSITAGSEPQTVIPSNEVSTPFTLMRNTPPPIYDDYDTQLDADRYRTAFISIEDISDCDTNYGADDVRP